MSLVIGTTKLEAPKKLFLTVKYFLAITLLYLIYAFFSPVHASCTVTGTTTNTFTYTAANINNDATINYSGTIRCTNGGTTAQTSRYMCMKTVFTGSTTSNNSVFLPYTVTATVGGQGLQLLTKCQMSGLVQYQR